ncbi:hypothetical protein BH11PSE2_BH11PSE2_20990 [soil metagenome]
MAWFLRSSAHGMHMVYGQQASNSCGIACIMMVNFKMKKLNLFSAMAEVPGGMLGAPLVAFNVADAVKLEKQVYAAYAEVSGGAYDGSADTDGRILPQVLNKLGIGTWVCENYKGTDLPAKISRLVGGKHAAPVILLVHWRGDKSGHFVVCDTVVKSDTGTTADFCDPWDAVVRTVPLTGGSQIIYNVGKVEGLVDLGQSRNDHGTSKGDMDGWIIHRVAH